MGRYLKDCNGVVHVQDLTGDCEYTLCGFAWDISSEDDCQFNGSPMTSARGPSNCPECKEAFEEIKKSLKGIRWNV